MASGGLHPIKRALISVSNKTGLEDLISVLSSQGVELISTGGTAAFIRNQGVSVIDVSEITGYPEMMEGRVKTLHPVIHGGILADRRKHASDLNQHRIAPIDLVVVNLYPFQENPGLETIDIGGPTLLRGAAKNHQHVAALSDPEDYADFIQEFQQHQGSTSLAFRRALAHKTFRRTALYDAAIQKWLSEGTSNKNTELPKNFILSGSQSYPLRYGENPHQKAAVYITDPQEGGILTARLIQGKELSYNNITDADAAWELAQEFSTPAVAIIKHASPCGVAQGKTLLEAWEKALACDRVSAFGGIVATNQPLDAVAAEKMNELFLEVVIAPSLDEAAQQILSRKKNLRVLILQNKQALQAFQIKSIRGGILVQEPNALLSPLADFKIVSQKSPSAQEQEDLLFANTVVKHVKSNAIVIAKAGQTLGLGGGQTSRVGSCKIALEQAGDHAIGAVAASDAFFPFADGLELLAKAGIRAIIQPGGSKNDSEVIAAADRHGIGMIFTGYRHFKH